uniref:Uncharacterized protein n=1 Tax=Anguilla anguilla TaxID=7936 RepID=A0A0E9TFJ7_ANGAN
MNNGFLNMASIGDFDSLHTNIPATRVEITVSCRKLLDMDTFLQIGPTLCAVHARSRQPGVERVWKN